MIKIKISELLGKHKMTQKKLSEITGIQPNSISHLYHETVKQINLKALEELCKAFQCSISDLLEYIPDDKKVPS